jgi:REP-associated tyrosine transposase
MARMARVVVAGAPHHVTQRGNRRQTTFFAAEDYLSYLRIAAEEFRAAEVEVWAYCLMPNHVHLIATPTRSEGLAAAVGATHLRYTRQVNQRERWTGYLWHGRFASFPMDETYLRARVRYVGLNPVRAGLVSRALDWPWSSVGAHVEARFDPLLTPGAVAERLGPDLPRYFETDVAEEGLRALRRASGTGRPLGEADWVKRLERSMGRTLAARTVGRPARAINWDTHLFRDAARSTRPLRARNRCVSPI